MRRNDAIYLTRTALREHSIVTFGHSSVTMVFGHPDFNGTRFPEMTKPSHISFRPKTLDIFRKHTTMSGKMKRRKIKEIFGRGIPSREHFIYVSGFTHRGEQQLINMDILLGMPTAFTL
jgi:hypothetical protein